MSSIILYHGSKDIIKCPEFGKGKANNDYGQGFYCTEHIELAKEWACSEETDGYANQYELITDGLSVLDLSDEKYNVLNWLAILAANRRITFRSPIEKNAADYLTSNFLPEYEKYDIIKGYRADDSYFAFARYFLSNQISYRQLGLAMKLGKLGEQIVIKSSVAFDKLVFMGFHEADSAVYYSRRKARDEAARAAFLKMLADEDADGIFIRDIKREEMKADDPRLQ